MKNVLIALLLGALLLWSAVRFTPDGSVWRWLAFVAAVLLFAGGVWLNNARR